ncbi:hypothetical protein BGZ74_009113 [Mortierella antarctica]|nr:hypothetical protein BGZ74_009113 [Mortierella antarctica]
MTISFHHSTQLPHLIVSDLDGTLLAPDHNVTKRSINALHNAQSHHTTTSSSSTPIQIMIASGRSPRSIQKVIDQFHGIMIPDAVLCCNGALTYNPLTKAISFPQFIPLDQAVAMVHQLTTEIQNTFVLKRHIPEKKRHAIEHHESLSNDAPVQGRPGFACEVLWFSRINGSDNISYGTDTFFVCDRTWEAERKHSIYYDYQVVDDMQAFLRSLQEPLTGSDHDQSGKQTPRGGIIKLLALDRNRVASEVYESMPASLRSNEPVGTGDAPQVTLTYSGPYFLEVSGPGVNKGLGLKQYCEGHGIARQDVVAFGDLLNDAEMLQYAGLGLCMGNGHPEMKKLADRVIGTNAEDGLAKEIESWFPTIIDL